MQEAVEVERYQLHAVSDPWWLFTGRLLSIRLVTPDIDYAYCHNNHCVNVLNVFAI